MGTRPDYIVYLVQNSAGTNTYVLVMFEEYTLLYNYSSSLYNSFATYGMGSSYISSYQPVCVWKNITADSMYKLDEPYWGVILDGTNFAASTIPSGYTKITNLTHITYESIPTVRGEETIYIGDTAWAIANWGTDKYTISFDTNGGTISNSTSNYTASVTYGSKSMTYGGSTHTAAPVPTRTGYTFAGWYVSETNGNGSGVKVFNADGSKNTDITTYWSSNGYWCKDVGDNGATLTLHAKWETGKINVYLKYIKDGDEDSGKYTTYQKYLWSSAYANIDDADTNPGYFTEK